MHTIQEFKQHFSKELSGLYNKSEIHTLFRILLEDMLGFSTHEARILDDHRRLQNEEVQKLQKSLNELKTGKPIQLITGIAYFLGEKYFTSPDALIPRPETEELVLEILKYVSDKNTDIRLLDIGTGSGCIAISLKKNLPKATVYALDISTKALRIAQKNAKQLRAEVHFLHSDILSPDLPKEIGKVDIIVSNPPYIADSEKKEMEKNVLDHEPHKALFVPDDRPLLFYEAIVKTADKHLSPHGKIFFEINQRFGKEVSDLLKRNGYSDVELIQDIHGADRIVSATKKG